MQSPNIDNKPTWVQQHILNRPNSDADIKAGEQYQAASKSSSSAGGMLTPATRSRASSVGNRDAISTLGSPNLSELSKNYNDVGARNATPLSSNEAIDLSQSGQGSSILISILDKGITLPDSQQELNSLINTSLQLANLGNGKPATEEHLNAHCGAVVGEILIAKSMLKASQNPSLDETQKNGLIGFAKQRMNLGANWYNMKVLTNEDKALIKNYYDNNNGQILVDTPEFSKFSEKIQTGLKLNLENNGNYISI